MLLARNVLLDDRRLDRYMPGVRTATAVLQLGPGGYHSEISCLVGLGGEAWFSPGPSCSGAFLLLPTQA